MSNSIQGPTEAMGSAFLIDVPIIGASRGVEDTERHLHATVRELEPGSVVLLRTEFPEVDECFLTASFTEDIPLDETEIKSTAVRRGQMTLDAMFASDVTEEVAIKSFDIQGAAVNEFVVNTYLNAVNARQPAFQPLGFWRNDTGQTCLLTKSEAGITPYDTIFWADEAENPEALTPNEVAKALRISSFSLGLLHGHGVVHGDAHAGNIAVDHEKVRFIDLESAKIFNCSMDGRVIDLVGIATQLARDIDTFVGSALQVPENRPVIAEVIEDQTDACVKSYQRGVKRAGGEENQLLDEVTPDEDYIVAIFQQAVNSI